MHVTLLLLMVPFMISSLAQAVVLQNSSAMQMALSLFMLVLVWRNVPDSILEHPSRWIAWSGLALMAFVLLVATIFLPQMIWALGFLSLFSAIWYLRLTFKDAMAELNDN